MARSEIAISSVHVNTSGVAVVKDAIDLTNNHMINIGDYADEKVQVFVDVETAPITLTIKAGDAEASVLGDMVITRPNTGIEVMQIESARFINTSGEINIDASSTGSGAGYIYAAGNTY